MQVYVAGRTFRFHAQCECGFSGARRWSRASAVLDVGRHAAQTGHHPVTVPFLTGRTSQPALQAS